MAIKSNKANRLVSVNARLFESDVKVIKGKAASELSSWHALLRKLVHTAVKELERPTVVR